MKASPAANSILAIGGFEVVVENFSQIINISAGLKDEAFISPPSPSRKPLPAI